MRVAKRDGSLEPVDLNKIVRAVARCAAGLENVDAMRVATRTISGLVDGATTEELDNLSIRTAAAFIAEEPNYSKLAARLLATVVDKEVQNQDIYSFSQSVALGSAQGIIGPETAAMVATHARKLNDAVLPERNWLYEFFGLRTVYDRYLLRHPETRSVIETPQYFLLRVACGLSTSPEEAIEFYQLISSLDYLPSSPTLFNSGTTHPQMSSCYLLDSPEDNLDAIYDRYRDVARLSKHAGGIGLSYSRIRSRGSLIRGTNGLSNGIVPWLKTLDSSVAAVNQGGRRKGAACVYLETWHADIEAFLELKENTGDAARRTHNLNLSNWVPDLFMERVEQDWQWSLFDPKKVPHLVDLFGDEFREAYLQAENEGLFEEQVPARQLYSRMMRSLAETGNGWMTFKDASNLKCNQTGMNAADGTPNVVHLSNLCTEILEVTNQAETAVCNLGSVNLGAMVSPGKDGKLAFDYDRLAQVVQLAVPFLDRVVDINFYPTDAAGTSNSKWRPVGLGLMGLQDVFFKLRLAFDSDEARELSTRISEEIYFHALTASNKLAQASGSHGGWEETRAAKGDLQFDLWGVTPTDPARWATLKASIAEHGLRNSLLIAIAPTATIASIAGCYECIEPQVSNLFKRETLSGEFLQINAYLVRELQALGLWTEPVIAAIKRAEGSVQEVEEIPEDVRQLFRTAWEIPMRSLIDMAAGRGAFIDQSQSLNLFMESPTIGKLSSMYMHSWKQGLKTTYYLRSRPATRINKTTTGASGNTSGPSGGGVPATPLPTRETESESETESGEIAAQGDPTATYSDEEAIACSLENPDQCEACQ
ncbi:MAG: ribonucleoside-diphosphate reductase subunit alpha [Actinobacteria bacterium]|nr:ribonucleoside-diphosphate reductase subunit alpha [Actinomycetota bacterium]MSY79731.1 ribonucleoside-diphosphate reductase subunit alpha [Actinomycetota bacterium]